MVTLVSVVTLVALSVYLLVASAPTKDVARIVAGVGAALWALLLVLPGIS